MSVTLHKFYNAAVYSHTYINVHLLDLVLAMLQQFSSLHSYSIGLLHYN